MTAPITWLLDAGHGHLPGGQGPILAQFCGRADCRVPPAAGSDFCSPCRAWLAGDTDEDPLTQEGGP